MKLLFTITHLFKRFGIILRGLGIALCGTIVFIVAIPDLKFNLETGNVQTYTEQQIIDSKKEELPLYLKVSNVEPIGEMYVTEMYQKKNETPRLSAIYYPVFNLKKGFHNLEELKNSPCNIVVKDDNVNDETIKTYFSKKNIIEGKFDQRLIDSETKKLLTDSGYNITDNCILIDKGAKFWSSSACVIMILSFGFLGILILLSILPSPVLHKMFKQEERFVRI